MCKATPFSLCLWTCVRPMGKLMTPIFVVDIKVWVINVNAWKTWLMLRGVVTRQVMGQPIAMVYADKYKHAKWKTG